MWQTVKILFLYEYGSLLILNNHLWGTDSAFQLSNNSVWLIKTKYTGLAVNQNKGLTKLFQRLKPKMKKSIFLFIIFYGFHSNMVMYIKTILIHHNSFKKDISYHCSCSRILNSVLSMNESSKSIKVWVYSPYLCLEAMLG